MTEADIYPLLQNLAGGNVYPYVVKLTQEGTPAVKPPWLVFSLSSRSDDVLCGFAEESTSLQIDTYAVTIAQARLIREQALIAISGLRPSQAIKQQFPDGETGLFRAFLEVQLID